jgi:hypothetical protein
MTAIWKNPSGCKTVQFAGPIEVLSEKNYLLPKNLQKNLPSIFELNNKDLFCS